MSEAYSSLERRTAAVGRIAQAFAPGSPERRELARVAGLYLHFGTAREFLRARMLLEATDPSPEVRERVRAMTPPRFDELPEELFHPALNEAYAESTVEHPSRPPVASPEPASEATMEGFFDPLLTGQDIWDMTDLFDRIWAQVVEPSEEFDALGRAIRVYFAACRMTPLRALIETEWAAMRRIGEVGFSDEEAEHLRRYGIDPDADEAPVD